MSSSATQTAINRFRFLVESVVWRYHSQGLTVRRRVQEKLLHDPLYRGLFMANRLPAEGLVLDLGCGQGVFLGLVASAQSQRLTGVGKRRKDSRLVGIELDPVAAESARTALGEKAEIIIGDLRGTILPRCRTAVLQDVLVYLQTEEQDNLLEHLVAALEPGGMLILRELDAGVFWMQAGVRLVNGAASLFRRKEQRRLYPRSEAAWQQRLEALGLSVERLPEQQGTGYGKTLLLALKAESGPSSTDS